MMSMKSTSHSHSTSYSEIVGKVDEGSSHSTISSPVEARPSVIEYMPTQSPLVKGWNKYVSFLSTKYGVPQPVCIKWLQNMISTKHSIERASPEDRNLEMIKHQLVNSRFPMVMWPTEDNKFRIVAHNCVFIVGIHGDNSSLVTLWDNSLHDWLKAKKAKKEQAKKAKKEQAKIARSGDDKGQKGETKDKGKSKGKGKGKNKRKRKDG